MRPARKRKNLSSKTDSHLFIRVILLWIEANAVIREFIQSTNMDSLKEGSEAKH
jgi:hypothetical protein